MTPDQIKAIGGALQRLRRYRIGLRRCSTDAALESVRVPSPFHFARNGCDQRRNEYLLLRMTYRE
jgi:hypothetical protein